ncbi:MAG TPA: MmgE/PrpD family protein [Phyllobacterium sp.]|nr:MmgE/PrpD family protein [Phyllobacterium sp.]
MLLVRLAECARQIHLENIPAEAIDNAKMALLDTVGVTLAGSREDCVTFVRKAAGAFASGNSTLFGDTATISPLDATLVNGTAAHALDFDDCSNTMGGHPSAPIVPALYALAERQKASGARLLEAYVAGFEVETKIGRAVNFTHYEKGWHPTSTLGTFGAAAACAHLLDLPVDRFAAALSLAASMASGLKANFGTMAKPYHVGHCSRNGLLAALLAAEGMTANLGVLEESQGFFNVYNGPGTFDADRLFAGFAAPFDLIDPGVAFKQHPCCASTHPALDALIRIMRENNLSADQVKSIRSWTHPRRLKHTNRPDPKSGLDAKFSVQYVLARVALEGIVRLEHFSDAAINDRAVRSFMTRIDASPHPDAIMDTTEHFFADVRVTTHDGDVFDAHVDRPLGRDRQHPLPPMALEQKFRDCAGLVLDGEGVLALEHAFLHIENQNNISDVSHLMRNGILHDIPLRRMGE